MQLKYIWVYVSAMVNEGRCWLVNILAGLQIVLKFNCITENANSRTLLPEYNENHEKSTCIYWNLQRH